MLMVSYLVFGLDGTVLLSLLMATAGAVVGMGGVRTVDGAECFMGVGVCAVLTATNRV
jgi:uncharacterized protein related to proFAR isomerase